MNSGKRKAQALLGMITTETPAVLNDLSHFNIWVKQTFVIVLGHDRETDKCWIWT